MVPGHREWIPGDDAHRAEQHIRGETVICVCARQKGPGSPSSASRRYSGSPSARFAGSSQRFARSSRRANDTTSGTKRLIFTP